MFGPNFGPPGAPGGSPSQYNYQALFMTFQPQQTPAGPQLLGTQIFSFFRTSNLPKAALAEIWKEATYGQSGGLGLPNFINAMKLITLGQNNQQPVMAILQQNPNIQPPTLQYPSGHQPAAAAAIAAPSGGGDQFSNLLGGFGVTPTPSPGMGLGVVAAPAGPTWGPADTGAAALGGPPTGSMGNGVGGAGPVAPPPRTNSYVSRTDKNQYAPPSSLLTRQSSLNVGGMTASSESSPPGERRGSSSWTDERLREQVRAAELRESQARKQANEARIQNERLERENEALQREAREARDGQSSALRQNQEALAAITPLRTENEQLKVALGQWKVLVEQKDVNMGQLEGQINSLNAQLKEAEKEFGQERLEYNDLKFNLETYKTRCEDQESRADTAERKNRQFEKERNEIELEKHKLELDNISLKRAIEDFKREILDFKSKPSESSLMSFGGSGSKPSGPSFAPSDDFSSFSPPPGSGNQFSPPTAAASHQYSPAPNVAPSGGFGPPGRFSVTSSKETTPASMPERSPPIQPAVAPASGGSDFFDFPEPEPERKQAPVQPVVQARPQPKRQPKPKTPEPEPDYYAVFAMSDSERDQYLNFFSRADATGRGRLNRDESVSFCRQSQLPDDVLGKLWVIVNRNNEMTPNQFAVMFHMCLKIKVGAGNVQAPPTLPSILKHFVDIGMPKQEPPAPSGFEDDDAFFSSPATGAASPKTDPPKTTPGGDDGWGDFEMDAGADDLFNW